MAALGNATLATLNNPPSAQYALPYQGVSLGSAYARVGPPIVVPPPAPLPTPVLGQIWPRGVIDW